MSGRKQKENDKIVSRLKEKYEVVDFVETQYRAHLTKIVNDNFSNYDLIVVTGGDGTLNEAVNGLAGKENAPILGYIPSGTCNDVARSLGIPKNVDKALDIILKGNVFEHDLMKVNQNYCIYVCGMGIFTSSSYSTNSKAKRKLGKLAYFLNGFKDVICGKTFHLQFESNLLNFNGTASLMLLMNSRSVAGFSLNKNADLQDGKIDVCIIHEKKNKKYVSLSSKLKIAKLFLFGYDKVKNTKRTKVVSIDRAKVRCCEIINEDGECCQCSDFELQVIQKGIKILC